MLGSSSSEEELGVDNTTGGGIEALMKDFMRSQKKTSKAMQKSVEQQQQTVQGIMQQLDVQAKDIEDVKASVVGIEHKLPEMIFIEKQPLATMNFSLNQKHNIHKII